MAGLDSEASGAEPTSTPGILPTPGPTRTPAQPVLSATIASPAPSAQELVGVAFTVTGHASALHTTVSRVLVVVDGGAPVAATATGTLFSTWTAQVTVSSGGSHTITATASDAAGNSGSGSVAVNVVDDRPQLTVMAPAPSGSTITVKDDIFTLLVQVQAQQASVMAAQYQLDGAAPVPMAAPTSGQPYWSGQLQLAQAVPVNGASHVLAITATNNFGVSGTIQVNLVAIDQTKPAVTFTPADGSQPSGTVNGAVVPVSATVVDAVGTALSSGVAGVTVQVDQGTPVPAQQSLQDPTLWLATVRVPAQDSHAITVTATDRQGNSTSVPHQVTVALSTSFRDLSEQTYLADLIQFAALRIGTGGGPAAAINESHLEEGFRLPFGAIAAAPPAIAQQPVPVLRLAVQALFDLLQPRAKAPIARWPLNDGPAGAAAGQAQDATGGGSDGTVVSGTWVAGRTAGTSALGLDGSRTYVAVGDLPQLVPLGPFSLAAWVNPGGPGSSATPGGVIAGREGQYLLGRGPDGTLHWAISTTTPGWSWVGTGVVVPAGAWSHVAIAFDGTNVRTYLNGALRHTGPASGVLGVQPNVSTEFRIGGRAAGQEYFQGAIAEVALYDRALRDWDVAVLFGVPPDRDEVWVDDSLPAGAQAASDGGDAWTWVAANPSPYHGTCSHQSALVTGEHQHYFFGQNLTFIVNRGDRLFTYVYLDPANPPSEVMLQFRDGDGSFEHRAFWGADQLGWGVSGTASRRPMGPLPPAAQWVRLEVPAALVGLEQRVVTGVAYTLFGGRATWDYTGKTGWASAVAAAGAAAAAYRALLTAIGTSYDELRLARSAPPAARAALAARLGFQLSSTTPDELAQLLRPLDAVSDADLESLFGLQRASGSVVSPLVTPPLLQQWRTSSLRQRWRLEDWGIPGNLDRRLPVADPDVVQVADLASPVAGNAAYDLWQQRTQWVTGQLTTLQAARQGQPSDLAGVQATIAAVLSGVDLAGLNSLLQAGQSIDAALAQADLTMAAFQRLVQLLALASPGPLLSAEWTDLCAILLQVLKRRNYPAWREQERARDVVLAHDAFVVVAPDLTVQLPAWRADWTTRLAWQNRLQARGDQLAGLGADLAAALDAAEQARLPVLRDALVAAATPPGSTADVAGWLSSTLLIDLRASPTVHTTPVGQAVETLQSALAAVPAGLLQVAPPAGLPASPAASWGVLVRPATPANPGGYTQASFDQEWQWMGGYATWNAAMSAFLHPENLLAPVLRVDSAGRAPAPPPTQSFQTFLADVAGGVTSAAAAHPPVQRYLQNIARELAGMNPAPPMPSFPGILDETLTEAALTAFASAQAAWSGFQGVGAYGSLPSYVRETFFEVPLQLAIALQQAGEHAAALRWLRAVYAYYRAPGQRNVYAGFALDRTGPATVQRTIHWLIDDLNPHAVVANRANTRVCFTILTAARSLLDYADAQFTLDTPESRPRARTLATQALAVLTASELSQLTGVGAIPPNPLLSSLLGRARAAVAKLQLGLNVAGLPRSLVPGTDETGAPPPSAYRYSTLVSRAQQLLASATEVEGRYLAALQQQDQEAYNLLKATQDLGLSVSHVALQDAQASVADMEVTLARDQRARAQTQIDTYSSWIQAGPNQYEQDLVQDYKDANQWRNWATGMQAAVSGATALSGLVGVFGPGEAAAAAATAGSAFQIAASNAETRAQIASLQASQERRQDEWNLQLSLAQDEATTADQQVKIAAARSAIAQQEGDIARQQRDDAQATVNFLGTKFTNVQLYQWMGQVLGGVYRYQIQQATAIAQLAQQQLAFERQQPPPAYIKSDYVSGAGTPAGTTGLTGTARLLEDLTQLDQFAFETNQRKLQITQTISLAEIGRVEFQRFRQTGVLRFATPMALFDGFFPGHYLRLIHRVRVSVVGLIPPTTGVRATLTSSGVSRTVAGGDSFHTLRITRSPETVALTSPAGASGVFDLDVQPELLLPFEGTGLDTTWELRMPLPANPFDFRSLADVQVTFDYTALASAEYLRQVVRRLPARASSTASLSLRSDFPDAWYALVAQAQAGPPAGTPLTASIALTANDFPPNLSGLAAEQVALMVLRQATTPSGFTVALGRDPAQPPSLTATTVNDIATTRNGSGAPWQPLVGGDPTGTWSLALANDAAGATVGAFAAGAVDDLVLVLTYGGDLPAWPQ